LKKTRKGKAPFSKKGTYKNKREEGDRGGKTEKRAKLFLKDGSSPKKGLGRKGAFSRNLSALHST